MNGTSLRGSISRRSPLCHEDCLMDVCPINFIVFGGMVITAASLPVSNCFTISSRLVGSDIHLSHTMSSSNPEDYKIYESKRSTETLQVFIGFCLNYLPKVIFPTIVTLTTNLPHSLTSLICHQCTNQVVSSDHYSYLLST